MSDPLRLVLEYTDRGDVRVQVRGGADVVRDLFSVHRAVGMAGLGHALADEIFKMTGQAPCTAQSSTEGEWVRIRAIKRPDGPPTSEARPAEDTAEESLENGDPGASPGHTGGK